MAASKEVEPPGFKLFCRQGPHKGQLLGRVPCHERTARVADVWPRVQDVAITEFGVPRDSIKAFDIWLPANGEWISGQDAAPRGVEEVSRRYHRGLACPPLPVLGFVL